MVVMKKNSENIKRSSALTQIGPYVPLPDQIPKKTYECQLHAAEARLERHGKSREALMKDVRKLDDLISNVGIEVERLKKLLEES